MAALPGFLRPREISAATTLSRTSVYDLIRSGRLRAYRVGNRWLVPAEEFERFVSDIRQGGAE